MPKNLRLGGSGFTTRRIRITHKWLIHLRTTLFGRVGAIIKAHKLLCIYFFKRWDCSRCIRGKSRSLEGFLSPILLEFQRFPVSNFMCVCGSSFRCCVDSRPNVQMSECLRSSWNQSTVVEYTFVGGHMLFSGICSFIISTCIRFFLLSVLLSCSSYLMFASLEHRYSQIRKARATQAIRSRW